MWEVEGDSSLRKAIDRPDRKDWEERNDWKCASMSMLLGRLARQSGKRRSIQFVELRYSCAK